MCDNVFHRETARPGTAQTRSNRFSGIFEYLLCLIREKCAVVDWDKREVKTH